MEIRNPQSALRQAQGVLSLSKHAFRNRRLTRREWHRLALGGLAGLVTHPLSANRTPDSRVRGVSIGAQSYSFRDRSLDAAIEGLAEVGIGSCELWQGHVEPRRRPGLGPDQARQELRRWRLTVPLEEFKAIRVRFDRAGIELHAYNLSFRDDFSDEEIARGFEMAKALGVQVLTASANLNTVPRIAKYAGQYRMRVGMHNHSQIRPNEFATPNDFARALAVSDSIAINLDIGHFTAADFDAVDFLRRHHDRIVTLHVKDRKRHQGPNVPFGQGDTPIREVLTLLRDQKWPIRANIEYEYEGINAVVEMKRCFDYCRTALG